LAIKNSETFHDVPVKVVYEWLLETNGETNRLEQSVKSGLELPVPYNIETVKVWEQECMSGERLIDLYSMPNKKEIEDEISKYSLRLPAFSSSNEKTLTF
jgi:hypothetical protein